MEKPKFASVRFKPLDLKLDCQNSGTVCWACYPTEGSPVTCVRFTEEFIKNHITVFEVTYPARKFEEGAYYKAKTNKNDKWEIVYFDGHLFSRTFDRALYRANDFDEIGDKIEL